MIRVISIIFLLFYMTVTIALPGDQTSQLHVSADTSFFDLNAGIYTYQGNVISTQGTSYLKGEHVVTKVDSNKQILSIVAKNKPGALAHYHTIPKDGALPLDAKADTIYFYPKKNQVILIGNATVTQGANKYTGPKFIYNLSTQSISTEQINEPSKQQRSHFSLNLDEI